MIKRKTKPILFGLEMVLALLARRKTQTRRKVKASLTSEHLFKGFGPNGCAYFGYADSDEVVPVKCPYHVGQILWVKETWHNTSESIKGFDPASDFVFYRADYADDPEGIDGELSLCGTRRTWLSSLFMPRSASRISLKIKSIKVERVQAICEADAIAEGFDCCWSEPVNLGGLARQILQGPVTNFELLWDELHGRGSWQVNEFVWVLTFEIIEIKE